jgi:hypothetical protein
MTMVSELAAGRSGVTGGTFSIPAGAAFTKESVFKPGILMALMERLLLYAGNAVLQ